VIVVDDRSMTPPPADLKRDARAGVIRRAANRGFPAARNRGIEHAWISSLGDDDLRARAKRERQLARSETCTPLRPADDDRTAASRRARVDDFERGLLRCCARLRVRPDRGRNLLRAAACVVEASGRKQLPPRRKGFGEPDGWVVLALWGDAVRGAARAVAGRA
jgi:glycosyltransferase involved in cell wall biosynthesis